MAKENTDKQKALTSWIMGRVEQWEQHRNSNYKDKWDEYYRLWRGIWSASDKSRDSEKSRLVAPALQQAIEATVAELEEATFGRSRWFDLSDDFLDTNPNESLYIRNLLHEDLEKSGVKDAVNEILLNGAIYGTGIGKIITEEKTEIRPVEVPVEGTLTTERTVQETTVVDVRLEAVSPKEFVIDPSATTVKEALGCAHVVTKPRYQIIQGIEEGVYEDKVLGSYERQDFGFDDENSGMVSEDDKVKIIEYWGLVPERLLDGKGNANDDFDYESDKLVEAVVTIANDSVLLRAFRNPFMMQDRPFVSYQHDTVPNKFWGRGVAEKGYNPQKALDAELRARIDSLALTTHPMMGLDATRLPRGVKFEVKPGKTILTNGDPRSVLMPLNFGQTNNSTFTEAAELERMIQMGTGAMDSQTSSNANPRNSTASGMSMMQAASIKRQKRTLMNFQSNFLIPFINQAVWHKIQFDPLRYPATDYKFIPYSSLGIMAKELEQAQMIQMLSMIPQGSKAFGVLLSAVFDNSSLHNKAELLAALQEMNQPPSEAEQMMSQLQMQKVQLENAQMQADVENTISETQRNIPEVEHLKSETILNLATAQSKTSTIGGAEALKVVNDKND